ncbi:carboxynorspermidine decarboxylase [Desulfocicer niacini]
MDCPVPTSFDTTALPSPCFVVDEAALMHNLKILASVKKQAGCRILLALKCFAMFRVFPLLSKTLDGVCASSPHEARLGREEFGREVHTFAAAYAETDIKNLCDTTDHLVFNSFAQLDRFRPLVAELTKKNGRHIELGIRINPEHSEGAVPIYDPCSPGSRLGIRKKAFPENFPKDITGLHWHNLCEQDADCLERTVTAVEERFGEYIPKVKYVNFGGGHHITRPGYDLDLLVKIIRDFKARWGKDVILEPGEAVALNAGVLVATVLDIIQADMEIILMDASVPTHMPDVLEMPYRPHIMGSALPGEKPYTCRIGGPSCLAGDVAGEYSFDAPLSVGDKLIFTDMAIYTMVKTNTFNGVQLPAIALLPAGKTQPEIIKTFGYEDFRSRLS